jgi:hypothetical protein
VSGPVSSSVRKSILAQMRRRREGHNCTLSHLSVPASPREMQYCAKQDARVKSPRVGFRPAFLGRYQGSVRLVPTLGGRVKQSQFAPHQREKPPAGRIGSAAAGGTDRAKQSQFRRRDVKGKYCAGKEL